MQTVNFIYRFIKKSLENIKMKFSVALFSISSSKKGRLLSRFRETTSREKCRITIRENISTKFIYYGFIQLI